MSFNFAKTTWNRVAFGDVVDNVNFTVKDPESEGIDRIIAMEHLDPSILKVSRWGRIEDGTTFTRRVKPGQTLFGKRRAYQRKAAYADFKALTSGDILVFEADDTILLPEFLPFLVQSDGFYDHALGTSAGSLSPRTNWRDLATYEFDLPPIDEQHRLADLLWTVERDRQSIVDLRQHCRRTRAAWLHSLFSETGPDRGFVELDSLIDPTRPVCYGVLKPGLEFEGGRLIVDVKDYPSGSIKLESVRSCDPVIEAGFKRSRLRAGDVLLSIRGTIGRVAVVPAELDGHNVSRDSARLSGDPTKVLPEFLKLILESPDVQDEIRRTTTGLAVKGINVGRIRRLRVPSWDLKRQRLAVSCQREISRAIAATSAAERSLVDLRRSLTSEIFEGAK